MASEVLQRPCKGHGSDKLQDRPFVQLPWDCGAHTVAEHGVPFAAHDFAQEGPGLQDRDTGLKPALVICRGEKLEKHRVCGQHRVAEHA